MLSAHVNGRSIIGEEGRWIASFLEFRLINFVLYISVPDVDYVRQKKKKVIKNKITVDTLFVYSLKSFPPSLG